MKVKNCNHIRNLLTINSLGIKLVFYSVPVGNMERLNQTRLIFFDTGQVIGASEIRSAWYM